VAGEVFILDTSADQFEIKNYSAYSYHPYEYHELGVAMIPRVIFKDPELKDRFWMYTRWKRIVNKTHDFNSLLRNKLRNIFSRHTDV